MAFLTLFWPKENAIKFQSKKERTGFTHKWKFVTVKWKNSNRFPHKVKMEYAKYKQAQAVVRSSPRSLRFFNHLWIPLFWSLSKSSHAKWAEVYWWWLIGGHFHQQLASSRCCFESMTCRKTNYIINSALWEKNIDRQITQWLWIEIFIDAREETSQHIWSKECLNKMHQKSSLLSLEVIWENIEITSFTTNFYCQINYSE